MKKMASDYRRLSLSIVKFKANPDNLKPEKRKFVFVDVKMLNNAHNPVTCYTRASSEVFGFTMKEGS